jgi:Na+/phosphate symporter
LLSAKLQRRPRDSFIFFTAPIARMPLLPAKPISDDPAKPRYLDPSALDTPALAISCAAREALRIGDVIAQMLNGMLTVLKFNDRVLAERLRKMDDIVDDLYTAVKLYLTQISREALEASEGRRWTDIVSFTINMEQVGDHRADHQDIEDKKIDKGGPFPTRARPDRTICTGDDRQPAARSRCSQRRSEEAGAPRQGCSSASRARRQHAPRAARRPDK